MLVTRQPVLRQFWYPVMLIEELHTGPKPFTLLGENLVAWLDTHGRPAVVVDRCCHRFAQLSRGKVVADNIQCPYHGWEFGSTGTCQFVPQMPDRSIPRTYRVQAYRAAARYDYLWVCLGEPLDQIPEIPEATDPRFRMMHLGSHVFRYSSPVGVDNLFDNSHHHYVHHATFGDDRSALPMDVDRIDETPNGIFLRFTIRNYGSALRRGAAAVGGDEQVQLVREMSWSIPFSVRTCIRFPWGAQAIIHGTFTPIADDSCKYCAVLLRDDTEDDLAAEEAIAEVVNVILEDQAVLEFVDPDLPLDIGKQQHMACDKAGIMMRRKFQQLLVEHGESEVSRHHEPGIQHVGNSHG